MRPLHLHLTNFQGYAELDLDLADLSLVAIGGMNGKGKSTLIHAFRYALYGRGRYDDGNKPREAPLVRRGTQRMQVILTFRIGSQVYRIARERALNRTKWVGTLEFTHQVGDEFKPLTEVAGRSTQQSIDHALGLDDATFCATSLLLQGQSGVFTQASPTKRKEYLRGILRLDLYPAMVKSCREKAKASEAAARHLRERVAALETIQGKASTTEADLAQQQGRREELAGQVERQAADLATLEARVANAEANRRRVTQAQVEVDREKKRWADRRTQIEREAAQGKLEAILVATLESDAKLRELTERKANLQDQWKRERQFQVDRRRQVERLEEELAQHDALASRAQNGAKLEARLVALEEASERFAQIYREQAKIDGKIHGLRSDHRIAVSRLETRVVDLGSRTMILAEPDRINCVNFSLAKCCFLAEAIHAEAQLPEAQEQIAKLVAAEPWAELEAEKDSLERESRSLKASLEAVGQVRTDLAAARDARVRLERMARAGEELEALSAAQAESTATLDRLADEGTQVGSRLNVLQEWRQAREAAEVSAATARANERLGQARVAHEAALEAAEEALAMAALDLEADLRPAAGEARAQVQALRDRLAQLDREMGYSQGQLAGWQLELAGEANAREELATHAAAAEEWRALEQVVDPIKGVPSTIVKTVLPELEAEANALLRELTQGEMRMAFVTEEDVPSTGAVADTLDIVVWEAGEECPYEGLSGGQGFKVDVSSRVGLSRILARRSGARLETLIIDEGFGALDAQGRDAMIAVLEVLRAHFSLILVIVHQDDILQRMPAQLLVEKAGPGQGSTVRRIA